MTANYAFKPTAEQALRSSQSRVPRRLNAALAMLPSIEENRMLVDVPRFSYRRGRGVVWVCDIENSSRALNANDGVSSVEEFLPRFYWASRAMVEASGGVFVKWTGDGFLAWYETSLHRDVGKVAWTVLQAAYHLSLLANVTRLGVIGTELPLRHGVTIEHDALITTIEEPGGYKQLDLIGRAVVLAFRASGASAVFPSVVVQREVLEACTSWASIPMTFVRWKITRDERLRYFKGETWGSSSLYKSGRRQKGSTSLKSVIRQTARAIARAEGKTEQPNPFVPVIARFHARFSAGGEWCPAVLKRYETFIEKELLEVLKETLSKLNSMERHG